MMAISIQLPSFFEEHLREIDPKLEDLARESLLIALYNRGDIGLADIADALYLPNRQAANTWLYERNVPLNYTLADLEEDQKTIDMLLGTIAR